MSPIKFKILSQSVKYLLIRFLIICSGSSVSFLVHHMLNAPTSQLRILWLTTFPHFSSLLRAPYPISSGFYLWEWNHQLFSFSKGKIPLKFFFFMLCFLLLMSNMLFLSHSWVWFLLFYTKFRKMPWLQTTSLGCLPALTGRHLAPASLEVCRGCVPIGGFQRTTQFFGFCSHVHSFLSKFSWAPRGLSYLYLITWYCFHHRIVLLTSLFSLKSHIIALESPEYSRMKSYTKSLAFITSVR